MSESTSLIFQLVQALDDEPMETVVIQLEAYVSVDDVLEILTLEGQDFPPEHEIEKRHHIFNWGASSETLEYVIKFLGTFSREVLVALIAGYIAQQVQAKRLGVSPLGDEAAENKASMAVLMAEPDLRKEDLRVISSKLDRTNGIETVILSSTECEYVVSIKRMKSGHSIVSYEKRRRI